MSESCWHRGVFGIPPSASQPVYAIRAQVLLAANAERALATGMPQPRDADAIADAELVAGVLAQRHDLGDHFVPGMTFDRCTGRSPLRTCRSVRHTPQARTATRSSPGAG
jgi:hypothetical protein